MTDSEKQRKLFTYCYYGTSTSNKDAAIENAKSIEREESRQDEEIQHDINAGTSDSYTP